MDSETPDMEKYQKMGKRAIILDIIALILGIATWIFASWGKNGVIANIPPLFIALTILLAAILIVSFILECIAASKKAISTKRQILDLILWVIGAFLFWRCAYTTGLIPW